MSIPEGKTFQEELERVLKDAQLPAQPHLVIGSKYQFNAEHGSHHFMLAGFVTSLLVSDEGGLDLEVSNKRFWGGTLVSLRHPGRDIWIANVEFDGRKVPQYFPGTFRLL